ncbi:hypothetical protein CU098_007636 [Rhizopus stolonifer]|uniref:PA domain-containing protein n=1 Tax=Rhizopus stolonifer TaxID=4846 RepID=A0A367KJN1_RHIST|nr:hypothetical protein CU098_007636 [Rhizopus stolonifer]
MQCRPIVAYSLATVLVLWILLGAITLPNANRWLKGFGSSIEQDRVSFRLDQPFDMHHAIVEKESHQSYHYNVFPITNTPHLPTHGLDGVLYDKGDACLQTTAVPNLNTSYANMSKVALIQQSSACYLVDKIHHAEIDGALAVIVFHNDPNVLHSSLADMV